MPTDDSAAAPLATGREFRLAQLRARWRQRPLVCDGAMGTQLQTLGLAPGECGMRWNLEAPDKVTRVHRAYVEAGADLVTTNTFSGTTLALAAHGLEKQALELNRAGAELARRAAGENVFVLGDMGPIGALLEPYGDVTTDAAQAAFAAQAMALLEGGADAILVETMSDAVEAALAISAARTAGASCVFATFTFQPTAAGFRTMMGNDIPTVVRAAIDAGAEVVGGNCGMNITLDAYAALAAEFVQAAGQHPVIVQPNAGAPELAAGGVVYRTSAASFGEAAKRFVAAGARMVGGCCGTTPQHISAVRAVL